MNILAINTITNYISVALLYNNIINEYCYYKYYNTNLKYNIIYIIHNLIKQNKYIFNLLIYGYSPSNYTYLRIVIGLLQVFTLYKNIYILGISNLSSLAFNFCNDNNHKYILSIIQIYNNNYYISQFLFFKKLKKIKPTYVIDFINLIKIIKNIPKYYNIIIYSLFLTKIKIFLLKINKNIFFINPSAKDLLLSFNNYFL